jgi:pimeloyl-ACP methyl ester carboxylesterase
MTKESREEKIARMDWREVRRVLQESAPSAAARAADAVGGENISPEEQALRDYYGEAKFRALRDLSERAAEIKKELGNVVLLPGIMGSHLSVESGGDEDSVWFNFWRIVKGDMARLELKSDGKTNANGENVKATGLIGWYYALALETLQAEPFPYDWRLNACDSADKLADFVREKFAGETVHFVAHSMGGLVVRNFIRQHKELWNDVKGRLVMLGTPNMGSFAAIQGLMGRNETARKLAKIDFFHNAAQLSKIINTFLGLYQLSPSQAINPEIYEETLWKNFPEVLYKDYLLSVPKFHQDLLDARTLTVDANRMTYIAGVGFATPTGLKPISNGNFDFETTLDGDGTVSHKLGLLEGVTTYYVNEAHADLPNNELVLRAVKDILRNGKTEALTSEKPATAVAAARSVVARSAAVRVERDMEQAESIAREISEDREPESVIVFDAEKKALRSILDSNLDADQPTSFLAETTPKIKRSKLTVQIAQGDITNINVPAVAVGQYQDLPPGGAIGAIDEEIDYWLTLAFQNGMIGAQLGQLFLVPLDDKQLNAAVKTVIVAGMGQYNRFDRDDLRFLTMNVALAVVTLGYDRFATVLMGTSFDMISIDRAVRGILHGIGDALERYPNGRKNQFTLVLVENKAARKAQIEQSFEEIVEKQAIKNLLVTLEPAPKSAFVKTRKTKSRTRPFFVPTEEERKTTRLTITRERGVFRMSLLTSNAAIPLREIEAQDAIIDSTIEKLRAARNFTDQEKYGRLLHRLMIPEDFQSYIDTNRSLTLLLSNREAAAIPWEMVGYGDARGTSSFGIDLRVSRQFSMLAAAVAGVAPPVNKQIKALVVADPARESRLQLPGARAEGEQLKNYFTKLRKNLARAKIDFQFEARIGWQQCDIADILSLIYEEEFDIVHFAGHGIFEVTADEKSVKSGWVFGENVILSPREIFRLRHVPRLVFANACFSSKLSEENLNFNLATSETNRRLAGLAEAFFARGIENYVGAGWQVDDAYAVRFAETFYEHSLEGGKTMGESLAEARSVISAQAAEPVAVNSTWGAYQHYGDANTKLVR